jgi:hypothetical protein
MNNQNSEGALLSRKGSICLTQEEISLLRKIWKNARQITVYLDLLEKNPERRVELAIRDIDKFANGIEKRLISQAELDASLPIELPSYSPLKNFDDIKDIISYLRKRSNEIRNQ